MKTKKLLTMFAILLAVFIAGCEKDKFVETVGVCPLVVSTSPANGDTLVSLNKCITATFNEKMNPATISPSSFTLLESTKGSGTEVLGTLTYDKTNATISFTPTTKLSPNATFIGRIKSSVKDLMGNSLQTDYVWTFSTGATLSPTVISTNPVNNATGVILTKKITATFSVPMDPLTITTTTFTLKNGLTPVAGSVSYSGTTATYTPSSNLLPGVTYTATITTGAKNIAGTPLANDYIWTFSTGAILSPTVISTSPADSVTGVVLNKTVTATFSVPMDPLTISTSTFTIKQGLTPIAGTVSYTGSTASFTPTIAFTPNTIYTCTITTGAKNVAGTPLANNYVWRFTTFTITAPTVIFTDPANNATSIALNKIITATFSVPMDPLTITATTFTLKQGATPVIGTVSYSGTTATFTPSSYLLSGVTYTATITTGAKNTQSTPLANNYVWNFSTRSHLGPLSPNLKSVARFGIISGVGVSNNAGQSEIHDMDVGINPGARSSVTGFPPAIMVNGAIYASDDVAPPGVAAMLTQAKLDLTAAYLFAEGASSPAPATVSGDQGGLTLAPGIYKSASTLSIKSGDLTLDAQGDVNAVWIFQIASGFTTVGGAGGNVILKGGAQAKNIYWQVGSSAIIGDYTSFYGNILALTSITMNSHATAVGRMLCQNGSVVLTSTNIINKP